MTSREATRHSAKLELVRSSELKESEQLWAPKDPLGYAARHGKSGLETCEILFSGRNKKEAREMVLKLVAVFALPFLLVPLVMILDSYQSSIGLPVVFALIYAAGLTISVIVFYIARSIY